MQLFHVILPCLTALSTICSFSGEGYLINNLQISHVALCTQNQSEFKEHITIKIRTDQHEIYIVPTIDYGYDPNIFLGDFIGNGLDQIFYSVNSGGSGAYSSSQLIVLQNGEQKNIYDSQNFENTAQARLKDQCVTITYLNQNYYLNASHADLSGEQEVFVSNVNAVMPVYNGGLKKYQIIQFQKIYIDYTANNIGYLATIIDFSANGATIVNAGTFTNFTLSN